jgi:hypothetical protein
MTMRRGTVLRVWGVPLLLMAATALGLVAALLGDGVWDALSWAALGVPLATVCWYAFARRSARHARCTGGVSLRRR